MEQRFEVASLLYQGMIYNDILERTGASSATISRVNRSLSYGTAVSYTHLDVYKRQERFRALFSCKMGGSGVQ